MVQNQLENKKSCLKSTRTFCRFYMWGMTVLTGSSATWTTLTDDPLGLVPRCRNGLAFIWKGASVFKLCKLEASGELGRLLREFMAWVMSPPFPTGIGFVTATLPYRLASIGTGFVLRPDPFRSALGSWVFLCDLSWLACVNVLSQCWHL